MSDDSSLAETAVQQQSSTDGTAAGTKRRQIEEPDELEEQEKKRQRISLTDEALSVNAAPEDSSTNGLEHDNQPVAAAQDIAAVASTAHIPENIQVNVVPRRKAGLVDEKQRSRRLFGSLLGTLGQRNDKTAKKRLEIEARTKAELRQQDDVLFGDQNLRQQRMKERRREEQWHVDQADMMIRHKSMHYAANFLQTTSLPRLHYRPWELRPNEQQRIDEEKRAVEERIEDEVNEFDKRRLDEGVATRPSTAGSQKSIEEPNKDARHAQMRSESTGTAEAVREQAVAVEKKEEVQDAPMDEVPSVIGPQPGEHAGGESEKQSSASKLVDEEAEQRTKVSDPDDEHMVEGDEDNVIY